jgi:hypothetical protein
MAPPGGELADLPHVPQDGLAYLVYLFEQILLFL